MIINGKEYKFRSDVSIAELREIRKFAQTLNYLGEDWMLSLAKDEDFEKAKEQWKQLCEKMFEKVDEDLDLAKISRTQILEIPALFFVLFPGIQNVPGN